MTDIFMPYKNSEADRVHRREYARQYRQIYGETLNATERQQRIEHLEEERQKDREYYAQVKTTKNYRTRLYYKNNRQEILAQKKVYNLNHIQERNVIATRRRARKKNLPATLTREEWEAIQLAYTHRCAYCGQRNKALTQDHVIPLSKGGGTTAQNIVPACLTCNLKKGPRLPLRPLALKLLL